MAMATMHISLYINVLMNGCRVCIKAVGVGASGAALAAPIISAFMISAHGSVIAATMGELLKSV